jgi:hypothetical protein
MLPASNRYAEWTDRRGTPPGCPRPPSQREKIAARITGEAEEVQLRASSYKAALSPWIRFSLSSDQLFEKSPKTAEGTPSEGRSITMNEDWKFAAAMTMDGEGKLGQIRKDVMKNEELCFITRSVANQATSKQSIFDDVAVGGQSEASTDVNTPELCNAPQLVHRSREMALGIGPIIGSSLKLLSDLFKFMPQCEYLAWSKILWRAITALDAAYEGGKGIAGVSTGVDPERPEETRLGKVIAIPGCLDTHLLSK